MERTVKDVMVIVAKEIIALNIVQGHGGARQGGAGLEEDFYGRVRQEGDQLRVHFFSDDGNDD
jgi:hypothetical protein